MLRYWGPSPKLNSFFGTADVWLGSADVLLFFVAFSPVPIELTLLLLLFRWCDSLAALSFELSETFESIDGLFRIEAAADLLLMLLSSELAESVFFRIDCGGVTLAACIGDAFEDDVVDDAASPAALRANGFVVGLVMGDFFSIDGGIDTGGDT